MIIAKADLEQYSVTAGCLGCGPGPLAAQSGECRCRLEKEMKVVPKLKVAKERDIEFLERVFRRRRVAEEA